MKHLERLNWPGNNFSSSFFLAVSALETTRQPFFPLTLLCSANQIDVTDKRLFCSMPAATGAGEQPSN